MNEDIAWSLIERVRRDWRAHSGHSIVHGATMARWVKNGEGFEMKPGVRYIETSNGYIADEPFVRRVMKTRASAMRKYKAVTKRMRMLSGHSYDVSFTHRGDVRIGCTMIHAYELDNIEQLLEE